ncbi:MAG: hypothetical protein RL519_714, partial [Pseudomonadota bacterium]
MAVHSAEPLRGIDAVLQFAVDGDAGVMRAVLERQFPKADLLVSAS